jgi:hypothetical protein
MKLKTLAITLLLTSCTLACATRFEFVNSYGITLPGGQNTGWIETKSDTGTDVPILEAIASFSFKNLDITGSGGDFLPDLPAIIAPVYTSLSRGLSFGGTMTWDLNRLTGFWSIDSPVYGPPPYTQPLLGGTRYQITEVGFYSFWPLEYFFNESTMLGGWFATPKAAVPETGYTAILLAMGVCGIIAASKVRGAWRIA